MNDVKPFQVLAFAALTLSVRILTWSSLIVAAALFVYSVIYPNLDRTIAACAFAVLIFLPSITIEQRRRVPQPQPKSKPDITDESERWAANG